jgi:rhamnosyltransferase
MIRIGIIIRTFNEAELLPRTLDAIIQQTEQSFKIIVVDSGSTDDTVKIVKSYKNIHLIEIPETEFSYGRALNLGIKTVADSVTFITMLSAHAIPCDKNWLSELISPMEEDTRIAGVYGKQIPLPEHLSNSIVRVLASDAYRKCYGNKIIITNQSYFFSNANAAIRISHWVRSPFDENLPGSEDWKWAKTMIENGSWLAYQPTARVYHSHPDTFKSFFTRRYNEEKASMHSFPETRQFVSKRKTVIKILAQGHIYLREIIKKRALNGFHFDSFCVNTIQILATYWGRKDARN